MVKAQPPVRLTGHNKKRSVAVAFVAVGLLSACGGGSMPSLPKPPSLPSFLTPTPSPPPAPVPAPSTPDTASSRTTTAPPAPSAQSTRPAQGPQSLPALFAQGKVNGVELIGELTAVRNLFRLQRSANAVGAFAATGAPGGAAAAPAAAAIPNMAAAQDLAMRQVIAKLEAEIKPYLGSIGVGALEVHLNAMIEDPQLLKAETLNLPSGKGLTLPQMQRIVNMAAILAATRVTQKILVKAKLDFANIENDYQRLIERREKAAQVLYDVLLKPGGDDPAVQGLFSEADTKYLRENVRKMSVRDFGNDLGAQNLALRYLRKTDPAAWGDYKGRSDGLRASTQGYIRTTAGVAAFAALLANFMNETVGQAKKAKGDEVLAALPFSSNFVLEAPAVLKAAAEVSVAGVIELPSKALKRFRIVNGGKADDVRSVSEVFAAMKQQQAESLFQEALFRPGGDGLVYKVFSCDRSEAGRMLDLAVKMDDREKFAMAYFGTAQSRFSFQNAFSSQATDAKERALGDELLRADHRQRTTFVPFGDVQRLATPGAARWNNDQLMRLILANREGTAAHATLQLGEMLIRPVPSMQSVFAYESLVDQCAKQFGEPGAK